MSIFRPLLPLTLAALAALALAPQVGCGGDDSDPFSSAGGSGPGGGGGSGGGGEPTAGDHVLISEVMLVPEAGEMVEIWNPTRWSEIDARTWARSRDLRRSLAARMQTKGPGKLGGPEGSTSSG